MNTTSAITPSERVIMAIISVGGKLFRIYAHPSPDQNGLMYLGRAETGGTSGETPPEWFENSLSRLNSKTSQDEANRHELEGDFVLSTDKEGEVLKAPWYVVFETISAPGTAGDLWVGRFFLEAEGAVSDTVKTWYLTTNLPASVNNDKALIVPEEAARSLVFATGQDAGGADAAEGAHGGSGGRIRTNW